MGTDGLTRYPAVESIWSHLSAAQRQVFHPVVESGNAQELLFQSQAALAKQQAAFAVLEEERAKSDAIWKEKLLELVSGAVHGTRGHVWRRPLAFKAFGVARAAPCLYNGSALYLRSME